MNQAKQKLGHPLFIFSVFLLLLNDWYLKAAFPGVLTGKLSDFAGLFALPFLLAILFPKHSKSLHILVALFFIAWKSTFIQPALDLAYAWGLPLHRTVDYSDFIALLSIPFSYFLLLNRRQFALHPTFAKALVLISAVAFVATSMPPRQYKKYAPLDKVYEFPYSRKELIARLNGVQLDIVEKSNRAPDGLEFDSEKNLFYNAWGDTLAVLLDGNALSEQDTIRLRIPQADILITGDESRSQLRLHALYRLIQMGDEKDYKTKTIKDFERKVVRKLE